MAMVDEPRVRAQRADSHRRPAEQVAGMARAWSRTAALIGIAAGVLSVLRDVGLLLVFGYAAYPDTITYLNGHFLVGRPYAIMLGLLSAGSDPLPAVLAQILLAGLAVAALTYVLAERHRLLGAAVGLTLILDVNWSIHNRALLSEGPTMSFAVLSVACLAWQYNRCLAGGHVSTTALLLAGILYAWTFTIRPVNVGVLGIFLIAYILLFRSWRTVLGVALGMAILLAATVGVAYVQLGRAQLVGSPGSYLIAPLYVNHLFDPRNGPASRDLDHTIRGCDPSFDYAAIDSINLLTTYVDEIRTCLGQAGWDDRRTSATYEAAYLEAIRAKPQAWLTSMAAGSLIFLEHRYYPVPEPSDGYCVDRSWCQPMLGKLHSKSEAKVLIGAWEDDTEDRTRPFQQVPMSLVPAIADREANAIADASAGRLDPQFDALVMVALLASLGAVWFGTVGMVRLVGIVSLLMLLYTAASVMVSAFFIPRYASVLSPFSEVLSVTVIGVTVSWASRSLRRLGSAVSGMATTSVARLMSRLSLRYLVAAVGLVALTTLLLLALALRDSIALTLPPTTATIAGPFASEQGRAYLAKRPAAAPADWDDSAHPTRSTLQLYENGRQLGPAHANHSDIRLVGEGPFSDWSGTIRFSTSDNSDPNTNGRRYTVQFRTVPSRRELFVIYLVGVLLGAAVLIAAPRLAPLRATAGWPLTRLRRVAPRLGLAASEMMLAGAVALCLHFVAPPLELLLPWTQQSQTLQPAFPMEQGNAYVTVAPAVAAPDNPSRLARSNLRLYEDGQLMGPAHTDHTYIRQTGKGLYSHWGQLVRFSASDNSDPNTNGRRYSVRYASPAGLPESILVLATLAAVTVGLRSVWKATWGSRKRRWP